MVSIVLTGIFFTFCGVTATENATVTLEQGPLQGVKLSTVWGKEYLAFRGIRYAKPPVGKLRFRVSCFLYVGTATFTDTEAPQVQAAFSLTKQIGDSCSKMCRVLRN